MDFGAVICKPKNPLCGNCPLKAKCIARSQGKIDLLPVKTAKQIKKTRWLFYLIAAHKDKIYVKKRGAKDIWENLYEFILFEAEKLLTPENLKGTDFFKKYIAKNKMEIVHVSKMYKQQLTHQTIYGRFIQVKIKNALALKGYMAVTYTQLSRLPFPKLITAYLSENELKAFER